MCTGKKNALAKSGTAEGRHSILCDPKVLEKCMQRLECLQTEQEIAVAKEQQLKAEIAKLKNLTSSGHLVKQYWFTHLMHTRHMIFLYSCKPNMNSQNKNWIKLRTKKMQWQLK